MRESTTSVPRVRVAVRLLRRSHGWLAAIGTTLGLSIVVALGWLPPCWAELTATMLTAMLAFVLLAGRSMGVVSREDITACARPEGIDGTVLRVPARQIEAVWIHPGEDNTAAMVIRRRLRPAVELELDSTSQAWSLIESSVYGPARRAVEFVPVGWRAAGLLASIAVGQLTALRFATEGAVHTWQGVLTAACMLAYVLAWPRLRVRVGNDGICLTRVWRSEFYGYQRIESLAEDGFRLRMGMNDGSRIVINWYPGRAQSAAVMEHIREMRRRFKLRELRPLTTAPAAWRRDNEHLLESPYREPHRAPEQLLSAVEDPVRPLELRVRLARIAPAEEPGDVQRLRQAAVATANATLRDALEARARRGKPQ